MNPARLERATSGSASLRSDPSELRVQRRRRCDSNAQGPKGPGGLAGRCNAIYATPPNGLAEGAGVEPAGVFSSDSFRDCSACPCPTFRSWQGRPDLNREVQVWNLPVCALAYAPSLDASGGNRTPCAHSRATALQAAAEPLRPLMRGRKFEEGGGGSPPSSPQGISVVKQQKERAGRLSSHRKPARSVQVSTNFLEIWGAGGRPPLD